MWVNTLMDCAAIALMIHGITKIKKFNTAIQWFTKVWSTSTSRETKMNFNTTTEHYGSHFSTISCDYQNK